MPWDKISSNVPIVEHRNHFEVDMLACMIKIEANLLSSLLRHRKSSNFPKEYWQGYLCS
jgi:hypothetical protein